jgi:hypothetical protein
MSDEPDNVVELPERIAVTLSPKVSKLIKAEMERQIREGCCRQTAVQIVEDAVRHYTEVLASKW